MSTPPPAPLPSTTNAGAGASVGTGGSGASIKRRHSRGRSITSRAEMMSARPNSAKARVDGGSTSSDHSRPTSPVHDLAQVKLLIVLELCYVYSGLCTWMLHLQVLSPTHHKSPTVTGTPHITEYESSPSFPSRPQSTIFLSHTAPMTIPEGKSAPVLYHQEPTKMSFSPLKNSPEQFGSEAQVDWKYM